MSDLISREYMKSLGATCIASRSKDGNMFPIVSIDELPSVQSEQELLKDGTLVIKTDFDMTKFDRVNVIQNGTHYGDLFYQDDDTRRKGEWIWDGDIFDLEKEYICSECRCYALRKDGNQIRSNFCPNCGCDMRGTEND